MITALMLAAAVLVPDTAIHDHTLKGHPFGIVASADSRHLFVAVSGGQSGIAAFDIGDAGLSPAGFARLDGTPADFALTPDGGMAVVTALDHVYFVDTAKLLSGGDAVLGRIDITDESINAAVSPDGRFAFIAEEHAGEVTVIDLGKVRAGHIDRKAVVNHIPVGTAPVGLALSNDGRALFVTVQRAARMAGWPVDCEPEDAREGSGLKAQGAVVTIDVAAAEKGADRTVAGIAPAGCNPVRIALSGDGATAYVTERGSGKVLALDSAKLISDPGHARVNEVAAGSSPVGIAVADGKLYAALSDRFAKGDGKSSVAVIDAATFRLIGTIPAGVFPREVTVTPDGRWLFIGNYGSQSLEQVDLKTVP